MATTYGPDPHTHYYAGSAGYTHAGRPGYHTHPNGSVGHLHPASVSTGHQYGHSYGPQHSSRYTAASTLQPWSATRQDNSAFFSPLPAHYQPAMPSALKQMSQMDDYVGPGSEQTVKTAYYTPAANSKYGTQAARNVGTKAPQVRPMSSREKQLREERRQRMERRQIEFIRTMARKMQRKKGGPKAARLLEIGNKDRPFKLDAEAGFDVYLMTAIGALVAGSVAVCCMK